MSSIKLFTNMESHLLQMRGLKPVLQVSKHAGGESHLLQMRGLKLVCRRIIIKVVSRIFYRCVDWNWYWASRASRYSWSHLLQMRGLKPFRTASNRGGGIVASFTDAWIETEAEAKSILVTMSHLLQMRGLKHKTIILNGVQQRRIFYRCVDWNWSLWLYWSW